MTLVSAQANLANAMAGAGSTSSVSLPQGTPLTGVVKAWYEDKGFGFLMPDGGGPDVFCHRNQLSDGTSPETGTQVSFEVRLNPTRGKYEATVCHGAGVLPAAQSALASFGVSTGVGTNKQVSDNLFVAGLPVHFSEDHVRAIFSQYGLVKQCKVLPANGKPDTAALIRMAEVTLAQYLVDNINGTTPQGLLTPISVRYADNRAEKAKALSMVVGGPPTGGGYGAMGAAGGGLAYNRFSPYGSVGGTANTAVMPAATLAAPGQAATSDASLSAAVLMAALAQLGAGAGQQTQDVQGLLQGLQGLQSLTGLGGLGASAAPAGITAAMPTATPAANGLTALAGVPAGVQVGAPSSLPAGISAVPEGSSSGGSGALSDALATALAGLGMALP